MDEKKEEILKALKKHKRSLTVIINRLEDLDKTDDLLLNRMLVHDLTFTMFELMDTLVNTEIDIYNYMKNRRG